MTRSKLVLAALALGLVFAGDVSPVGSTIEVETYRCKVESPYRITCENIGRVCVAARAKYKKEGDYYFGCALDDWKKKHPKEVDDCFKDHFHVPQECWPLVIGGY